MEPSPYIRPELWATASGAVDPAAEWEAWLIQARGLLDAPAADEDPMRYFELIALYGRFRRAGPDWRNEPEAAALIRHLERRLTNGGRAWIERALQVPNPAAWLRDVEALEASFAESDDAAGQADAACSLLEGLDDTDLVCWYARTEGADATRLAGELDECHFRLAYQPDTFLPSSVYVQAMGQLLRPDLNSTDPALAETARKFVLLLDEFEAAERDAQLLDQPPLPDAVRKALETRRLARCQAVRLSELETRWPLAGVPAPGPTSAPALAAADDDEVSSVLRRHPRPPMGYHRLQWPVSGSLVLVRAGQELTLLCYTNIDAAPPAVCCSEPGQAARQLEWQPSPVRSGLYRAALGRAETQLVIWPAARPDLQTTILP